MLVASSSRARSIALRTAAAIAAPLVRRATSIETAWMTKLGRELAGRGHDGAADRDGRLADRRELDRVPAAPLQRTTDPGRHPEGRAGRVDDRIDLEVTDVPVPELYRAAIGGSPP